MRFAFFSFIIYSAIGCALETLFAAAKARRFENRKTMLMLPLCPVYGLGALAIVLAAEAVRTDAFFVVPAGILFGSAVEYLYSYACETAFRVKLWDYSGARGSIHGRVNVLFSVCWGALSALLVSFVQPKIAALVSAIPAQWFYPALGVFIFDAMLTSAMLYRFGRRNGRMVGCPVAKRIE